MTLMSYENIVVMPYNIRLDELKIESSVNSHTTAWFTGIINKDERDKVIKSTNSNSSVAVMCSGKTLFKGIVTSIKVKIVRDVYYLDISALSYTKLMDIQLKNRSFQNKEMQYGELIKKVTDDYDGTDFIDTCSKGKKLEKFILQYQETDWEFLKRMASHFNTGLIADGTSEKLRFWFGKPEGKNQGKLDEFHYSIEKRLADYRISSNNYVGSRIENDFVYFSVESKKDMSIGDTVQFKNIKLYVCQKTMTMSKGILLNEYILVPSSEFNCNPMLNNFIGGLALEGEVLDVMEDNLKVHLDIDPEQKKEEAYWFPYATYYTTEGQTGWYCMPEIGDRVKLYFPTSKEEKGIVENSVRRRTRGGDKVTKPDEKFFRTSFGKEIKFNEKEVVVTGKDNEVLIRLHEDDGVLLYSSDDIKIDTKGDLSVTSHNKILIEAGNRIEMSCNESNIQMDGGTYIKGSKIKRTSTGEMAELPMFVTSEGMEYEE